MDEFEDCQVLVLRPRKYNKVSNLYHIVTSACWPNALMVVATSQPKRPALEWRHDHIKKSWTTKV